MKVKRLVSLALLVFALVVISRLAGAHSEEPPLVAATAPADHVGPTPPRSTFGSRAEEQRYAEREATSPAARNFRGGDVIVISATAVAIVLLVILIIVLI